MDLYFHHVGKQGAERDFPKTVFGERSLALARNHIPTSNPRRGEILAVLEEAFPAGTFNCWGVPAGASSVIQGLEVGDAVLLVRTTSGAGDVPALCPVRCYWDVQLPRLSAALWGEERFPYIFFFETEPLELDWSTFADYVDYSSNWNPAGNFYRVAKEEELATFGGAAGFVDYLRDRHRSSGPVTYSLSTADKSDLADPSPDYEAEVDQAFDGLQSASLESEPDLTGSGEKTKKESTSPPRSEAFRVGVRRIYGRQCAVCGLGAEPPGSGEPIVDSAHIYPKSRDGSDDLRNGLCLCKHHHWAFDAGWFALTDDLVVVTHPDLPEEPDYEFIRAYRGDPVSHPKTTAFRPHRLFLDAHRELHEVPFRGRDS